MLKSFIIALVFLAVGISSTLFTVKKNIANAPEPSFHAHADFAVVLNSVQVDFSKDEYMSIKPCVVKSDSIIAVAQAHGLDLEEAVHLHSRDGNVAHAHQPGVTWHDFFESLKMGLEDNLFVDAEGNQYQEDENNEFRFFVNGEEVDTLADREINDLDQVLISYFDKVETPPAFIAFEQSFVTNNACLFSGSCPSRGLAPLEACGGIEVKAPILEWLGL